MTRDIFYNEKFYITNRWTPSGRHSLVRSIEYLLCMYAMSIVKHQGLVVKRMPSPGQGLPCERRTQTVCQRRICIIAIHNSAAESVMKMRSRVRIFEENEGTIFNTNTTQQQPFTDA